MSRNLLSTDQNEDEEYNYLAEPPFSDKDNIHPSRNHSRYRTRSITSSFLSVTSTLASVLLLLNLVFLYRETKCAAVETGAAVYDTTYSHDDRYMSLDHQFDKLWDPMMSPIAGMVVLPDSNNSGRENFAEISM